MDNKLFEDRLFNNVSRWERFKLLFVKKQTYFDNYEKVVIEYKTLNRVMYVLEMYPMNELKRN